MIGNFTHRFRIDLGLQTEKREHITPYLKAAHFLPVKLRICYKLCIEVFKVLNNISPSYLADLLFIFVPKRQGLRSSTDYALVETSYCEKSLAYAMCKEWNTLPFLLRSKSNLEDFKRDLKTYYFTIAFS